MSADRARAGAPARLQDGARLAVQRWRGWRQRLWDVDLDTLPPLRRRAMRVLRFAVVVAGDASRSGLSLRATALVHPTLLSLVPFLAVTFSVLKAFGVHQQLAPVLERALEPLGDQGRVISEQMVAFVDNLKVGVLGALGVAGLFLTAILLLGRIEDAFNHIWRVRRRRSVARQFTDYLSVLLVGPVLVFTAFGLTASARSSWIVARVLAFGPVGAVALPLLGQVLPLLMLAAAFTVLYRFMPHTRVHASSAFVGGAVAAVLWDLASVAFTTFVAKSPSYAAIYKSLAFLVLFLVWMEYAWLVVLLGAEVAFIHQHPATYETPVFRRTGLHRFRELLALDALRAITRRHLDGQRPWRSAELATALRVPPTPMEDLVEELVRRGVLLRSAEPAGVALARPPETVTVVELLAAVSGDAASVPAADGETSRVLARRDAAVSAALAGMTLRDLASG